jgi:hypothetical protein
MVNSFKQVGRKIFIPTDVLKYRLANKDETYSCKRFLKEKIIPAVGPFDPYIRTAHFSYVDVAKFKEQEKPILYLHFHEKLAPIIYFEGRFGGEQRFGIGTASMIITNSMAKYTCPLAEPKGKFLTGHVGFSDYIASHSLDSIKDGVIGAYERSGDGYDLFGAFHGKSCEKFDVITTDHKKIAERFKQLGIKQIKLSYSDVADVESICRGLAKYNELRSQNKEVCCVLSLLLTYQPKTFELSIEELIERWQEQRLSEHSARLHLSTVLEGA